MSFSSAFPFNWEEDMEFFNKCQESVDISKIPSENGVPAIEFEEFRDLFVSSLSNKKKRKLKSDRFIVGMHSPQISQIPIFSMNRIETTTNYKEIRVERQEPAQKKQKLTDWRTGNNQRINDEMQQKQRKPNKSNDNNNNNKSNESNTDFSIPPGCECLFDPETGELIEDLSNLDRKLVESIGYELLNQIDNISFTDIAGLKDQKQRIKEIVIWPLKRCDIYNDNSFNGLLEPPKGVLLFGPPGTGKTMIAKAIASESNANFFSITPSTLTSKWVGESAKLVKTMFAIARFMAPSIVFIDEVDSLLGKRQNDSMGGAGSSAMNQLKTQFLMEFQGAGSHKTDGYVLIIGATNFPEAIDEAARRRLAKKLYIPLPDKYGRKQLFQNLLIKTNGNHKLNEQDIEILVNKTNGYSGSDISDVAKEAAHGPLRDVDIESCSKESIRPMILKDFINALKQYKPSVTEQEIKKYQEWNQKFGSITF